MLLMSLLDPIWVIMGHVGKSQLQRRRWEGVGKDAAHHNESSNNKQNRKGRALSKISLWLMAQLQVEQTSLALLRCWPK